MELETPTTALFLEIRKSKLKSRIRESILLEGPVSKISVVEKAVIPPDGEVYISRGLVKGVLKGRSDLFSVEEWLRIPVVLGSKVQPYSFRMIEGEEKEEILKEFNVTIDKFPTMLTTDIIARIYGAKEGDLFEIRRVYADRRESLEYRGVGI